MRPNRRSNRNTEQTASRIKGRARLAQPQTSPEQQSGRDATEIASKIARDWFRESQSGAERRCPRPHSHGRRCTDEDVEVVQHSLGRSITTRTTRPMLRRYRRRGKLTLTRHKVRGFRVGRRQPLGSWALALRWKNRGADAQWHSLWFWLMVVGRVVVFVWGFVSRFFRVLLFWGTRWIWVFWRRLLVCRFGRGGWGVCRAGRRAGLGGIWRARWRGR